MKYRKKPIVIEAHQWFKNGDHPEDRCVPVYTWEYDYMSCGKVVERLEIKDTMKSVDKCKYCKSQMMDHGWIKTLEGGHIVCPGDYIITGVKGERYPCKPDIFKQTYEKVD